MRHINALLNSSQYDNLMTLLRKAREYDVLEVEEIDELEEVLL